MFPGHASLGGLELVVLPCTATSPCGWIIIAANDFRFMNIRRRRRPQQVLSNSSQRALNSPIDQSQRS